MKRIICVFLTVFILICTCCTACASGGGGTEPGQTMPDFTVSLTDNTSASLSELLADKDLVVLNVFATWCGPCELEFPDMEKVYEANSDRMVILSVSGDSEDTLQMVADYKASHFLTFPMGIAGKELDFLGVTAYPTTYFITHDGKIGFIKVGAFTEKGAFEEKVNHFLSEDYDGVPLASEEASSNLPKIGWVFLAAALMLVIGRWRLFSKAGTPGWYSLIPVLSTYKEFALGWQGWIGILSIVCQIGSVAVLLFVDQSNLTFICTAALLILSFVLKIVESIKLAKAFGKGVGTGLLLTVFEAPGRFILGLSKAKYCSPERQSME